MEQEWLSTEEAAQILGLKIADRARDLMKKGTKVAGRTIKLKCRVVGDRYQTTQEWINEYLRENTEARVGEVDRLETPTQETRRAEKAKARVQSKHQLPQRTSTAN